MGWDLEDEIKDLGHAACREAEDASGRIGVGVV